MLPSGWRGMPTGPQASNRPSCLRRNLPAPNHSACSPRCSFPHRAADSLNFPFAGFHHIKQQPQSMSNPLDATKLLAENNVHRLVLQATLVPVTGDLFQPAGFPDIGHVIYDAPRKDGSKEKICVVDSAAS